MDVSEFLPDTGSCSAKN